MIEIILTRENIGKHELVNNSWLYGINKNDTKPQFEYFQYYYNLIDVIHEWLYDNNIDYDLRMDDDGDA